MIIAVVGMTGSGKTTVSEILKNKGFEYVRLGQITLDEVKKKGIEPTEQNEEIIRKRIREEHGMDAFATLNFPEISMLAQKGHVVVDGLYAWKEYTAFRKKYKDDLIVLAVCASPNTRIKRLKERKLMKTDKTYTNRPLSDKDVISRDKYEITEINKGGPIAMADYTIVNEGTFTDLKSDTNKFLELFFLK